MEKSVPVSTFMPETFAKKKKNAAKLLQRPTQSELVCPIIFCLFNHKAVERARSYTCPGE